MPESLPEGNGLTSALPTQMSSLSTVYAQKLGRIQPPNGRMDACESLRFPLSLLPTSQGDFPIKTFTTILERRSGGAESIRKIPYDRVNGAPFPLIPFPSSPAAYHQHFLFLRELWLFISVNWFTLREREKERERGSPYQLSLKQKGMSFELILYFGIKRCLLAPHFWRNCPYSSIWNFRFEFWWNWSRTFQF